MQNIFGYQGRELLKTGIPENIQILLLLFYVLGTVLFFFVDRRHFFRDVIKLLLVEYLVFLIGTTVLFRGESPEKGYNLLPFWSYYAIGDGQVYLIMENILNIILFIPLGLLSGLLWKGEFFLRIAAGSLFLSLSIEVFQFLFKRGFSELDDVIHNFMGCVIGFVLSILLIKTYRFLGQKNYHGMVKIIV